MKNNLRIHLVVFIIVIFFIFGSTSILFNVNATIKKASDKNFTGTSINFTIIVLPDTQYYSKTYSIIFTNQTQWIVDHRDELNIVYVAHEGDIVENVWDIKQWNNASTSMSLLENSITTHLPDGIPYSMVPGNHDHPTTNYNQYFGVSRFNGRSYYGGHYSINNDNNYVLFNASGMSFIAISLDFKPNTNELNWADNLLRTFHNRRAIIISHYILNLDGSFGGNGFKIYNNLKHNSNLFLILCGHTSGEARRTDLYHGNKVYSVLANYQKRSNGGDGWLRIMEFCPATNEIKVRTYSTYLNQFETDADSEFTLN